MGLSNHTHFDSMQLSINSNPSATSASFHLSNTMDAHRRTLARLSSGKRIVSPADDAGGLAVGKKLGSRLSILKKVKQNNLNSKSFTDLQYGALKSATEILSRMSELKTMSLDTTKNQSDVENYNKEFLELQLELKEISREKFNGISLFTAIDKSDHALQSIASDYTNPGNVVSLARNFIKSEFVGSLGHTLGEFTSTTSSSTSTGSVDISTKAGATGVNPDGSPLAIGQADLNWTVTGPQTTTFRINPIRGAWVSDNLTKSGKWIGVTNGSRGNYTYSMSFDLSGVDLNSVQISGKIATDDGGELFINGESMGIFTGFTNLRSFDLQSSATGILVDGTNNKPNILVDGVNTVEVRVNNVGGPTGLLFDELKISASQTTTTTTTTTSQTYPGLRDFTQEDFTGFIEQLADAIAQVGAEQSRLDMNAQQLESAEINLEAAHGRIMDVDMARESTRYSKTKVLVQSSASMVSQANKQTDLVLRLMVNR